MRDGEQSTVQSSRPSAGKLWTFIRIMNVRLRFIFLMVLVGLVVGYWENITNYYDRWTRPQQASAASHTEGTEFYCPMHPNIVRDSPGNCPICGMPLSERAKTGKQSLPEGVLSRVQLTPAKVELGRIGTSPAAYRLLSREVRTVGLLDYDERLRTFIAARIKGRIEKLFVDYTGSTVKKGDPLVSIYSPDLLVAQEELLTAVRGLAQQKGGGEIVASAGQAMVEAARKKLQLWGITDEQIDEVVRKGNPQTDLTIYSPMSGIVTEKSVLEGNYVEEGAALYTVADLSRIWMQVKIFEDQIAGIKVGTAVQVTSVANPEEVFAGRITFVAYTVDSGTRTVAARVEIDNPDYKLKPGMYATAVISTPVGAVTDLSSSSMPASEPGPDHLAHGVGSMPALSGASVTDELAQAYLALTSSFAHDKADNAALAHLLDAAKALTQKGPASMREQASAVVEQATQLNDKELKEQRKLLKTLSDKVVDLLKASPPKQPLFVAYCSMRKANWLQSGKTIQNPYYGSEMLDCGEIKSTIEPKGGVDEERFATGFFCPVTPDRLYDKPEHCPLDRFPMKAARVEKVLAIPESAVIDTGTRQVVYRESSPGTFDMIQVKLGARAGDFYPVLSGLSSGDQVATVGAFLVDAENRLNPAASAQFFGASGGPQTK